MNAAPIPERPTLLPGTRLGAYEILQRLGAGGMGEIYRARDTRLGREVAIKTISIERLSHPEALPRFEQEARSASALNHPNIVTIYELGDSAGTHYIAMELVCGETIRELLAAGPVSFRKVITIAAQIADALAKAHESGIIHRDLKPENLMVTADGMVKILDFGLAKLFGTKNAPASDASTDAGHATDEGTVMGTIGYMSPEQATGAEADFRSDQFSFASVLYEMVTGTPAFQKATYAETAASILRDQPERLAAKNLQAPAPFVWIIERCLNKDARHRYSSTRELARDLVSVRDRLADFSGREPEARSSNLPSQRTNLIGRERESAALNDLLYRDEVRLVTLTGPGGIGKTRLAQHVASESVPRFPDGICFVPLAAVTDPGLIASAITQSLGLRESANRAPQDVLEEYLRARSHSVLLLLDNFEHLVSTASFVANLLSISPQLKIVVTSQAALHLYGEHEFPVPPLALPDANTTNLETLSRLAAVALFVERARAVKPDFAITKENASAVAAICRRLDGLPLAIELAAARIKLLTPAAMQARLEGCLNLLTGGARDLPTRQQTLRGTVDWSYNLLNPEEQTMFRRLSVFIGGCTLDGVEAVCDTRGDLGLDVLDGIASIVDKSLAQQLDDPHSEPRFVMLSTIRDYARERLAESGEEFATCRAHAAYFLILAEEGAPNTADRSESFQRLDIDHDNLRSALEFLIRTKEVEWALRMGAALFRFWETREYLTEGRDYINRLIELEKSDPRPKLRARLLFAAAVLAGEQGDYINAAKFGEASLETCVEIGDRRGCAVAMNAMAVNARDLGDYEKSTFLYTRCLEIWKEFGDSADIARALSNLANLTVIRGDYDKAAALYGECITMFRRANDEAGVAWTQNYLGDVYREKNDYVAARSFYEQSIASFRRLQDGWGVASVLSDLARLSWDQGDNAEARRLYGESIKIFQELGHKRGIARVLECLAASAAAQSNADHSLHLAGAAAALRQKLGAPLTPAERPKLESALEFARRTLGPEASLKAWMEGWSMPLEAAVQAALS